MKDAIFCQNIRTMASGNLKTHYLQYPLKLSTLTQLVPGFVWETIDFEAVWGRGFIMHFAFCLFKYFPYGGLQRDFIKITRAALARGHHITVFTMAWQGPIEANVVIKLLPNRGISNHRRAWLFSEQVRACLARQHFDAVLGFNRQAGLDFYFAADPCLAVQLSFWQRLLPRYRCYLALERAVYGSKTTTQLLLLDPKQQALSQVIYHTPDARFSVIPPGIDRPLRVNQAMARAQVNLTVSATERVLLAVGYDQKRKGIERSLIALAALPQALRQSVQLWVVGSVGIDAAQCQAKALGIGAQVHFLGNRQDVYTLMQAADLLLHPAYQETAGMVLVEALANGLPVLVTENCGYAFHVAKASAGKVVPGGGDYSQITYNAALHDSLLTLMDKCWQANALHYAERQDLFTMPTQVIKRLEQFACYE